jgi:hypothetical protein
MWNKKRLLFNKELLEIKNTRDKIKNSIKGLEEKFDDKSL